jgi:hypothetical protein
VGGLYQDCWSLYFSVFLPLTGVKKLVAFEAIQELKWPDPRTASLGQKVLEFNTQVSEDSRNFLWVSSAHW